MDKNDPTIEKIVVNPNQATTKIDYNDNVKNINNNQQMKNSENKPQPQNGNNIKNLLQTKPKINENALPSLDSNLNKNSNSENDNSNKKQTEEKPKTGLAALLAKESTNKSKPATIYKDAKPISNITAATQAKNNEIKSFNSNVQISQNEFNERKKSENVTSNESKLEKSDNKPQNNKEKISHDQAPKSGLAALLHPEKNKQIKTPNKTAEKGISKEEPIQVEYKITALNPNINQIPENLQDSPMNENFLKDIVENKTNINEAEKLAEENKATQNLNARDKPKKIMILNKNKNQNENVFNNKTSPNENLIDIENKKITEEFLIAKDFEELNIKANLNKQQEMLEFQDSSENINYNNNYNYHQDDEFDRSKYSKDIPISNSNDYYRNNYNNNNNNKRNANKRNQGDNYQMMKIAKNNDNNFDNNNNNLDLNNSSANINNNLNNNYEEKDFNRNFSNNNKFYQNNNNKNNPYNNNINNPNFNYQNNRINPNMTKDQQLNKFNNFNKNINNNNNYNNYNNNRRFNNNNSNFDNSNQNQTNLVNKKFNNQTQGNFLRMQAPFNIPNANHNIPNNNIINNFNTSLSFNYQHHPQMSGMPMNQYQNTPFEEQFINTKNMGNMTLNQQAYLKHMNPDQFALLQQQMLMQNQANSNANSNKNLKANPKATFQNPQFPMNTMNMNHNSAAFSHQQGMYQQNMGLMGISHNQLISNRNYANMQISGNTENSPNNIQGKNI